MLQVIIPMAVLLIIVLCKKLPLIGGNINAALLIKIGRASCRERVS